MSAKVLPNVPDKRLWIKTDNRFLTEKLALRRYFLDKYPRKVQRVIDCCAGEEQKIWKELRKEYPNIQYMGLDKKKVGKSIVKIEASRWMSQVEWQADIVDIDPYGEPWPIYFALLEHFVGSEITVFLTYCYGGLSSVASVSHSVRERLDIPKEWKIWNSFTITKLAIQACVAYCLECGFEVVEARKITSEDNFEDQGRFKHFYAGLRLRWLK